ncbi:MAG TPA: glycosyltransferase family 4 protein, partial [Gaiellaceae bacterium]|nr:glycosyltransferase family 4 protein [Gaiellaceae bacterium]
AAARGRLGPRAAGGARVRAGDVKVVHVHRIRGIGGSERHLLTLLPALAEREVEVVFLGLDDPDGVLEPFYRELRVEAVRLACPRDLDPSLAWRVRRELRRLRPDVVHTHLVHADVYGALGGGRAAVVSTKHNDDRFRLGPFRYAERTLTRRAARVIAITEALRRFCVEGVGLPAEKVEVVHYGLDSLPEPWGESAEVPVPEDARVLLCVARLAMQKGVDVAVRALVRVREREPRAVLVVLGEGPERRRLEALAGDGVYLPGRVGDVASWYRRADLLVHPARWEGFGLALLEAMLAAKPVVATRVSSAPEIVADGETGLLVAPDDADALADAVSSLLADSDRAAVMGLAGLDRARSEFSVARMAERTMAVYAKT